MVHQISWRTEETERMKWNRRGFWMWEVTDRGLLSTSCWQAHSHFQTKEDEKNLSNWCWQPQWRRSFLREVCAPGLSICTSPVVCSCWDLLCLKEQTDMEQEIVFKNLEWCLIWIFFSSATILAWNSWVNTGVNDTSQGYVPFRFKKRKVCYPDNTGWPWGFIFGQFGSLCRWATFWIGLVNQLILVGGWINSFQMNMDSGLLQTFPNDMLGFLNLLLLLLLFPHMYLFIFVILPL